MSRPPTLTTIDDPNYWARLSDEQVIEQMQRGQPDSPIWKRAKGELEIRERKRQIQAEKDAKDPQEDFSFITSLKLRRIAERDWKECCRARTAKCQKSVLILVGGILEAVLLSALSRRSAKAKTTAAAKGQNSDITRWELGTLLAVAKELRMFAPAIDTFPSPLRKYRNLSHPGFEIRENINFNEHDAETAFSALRSILAQMDKKQR